MKRFDAIIFDMDGVIVNSEPLHERAFQDIFTEIGLGETHGICFSDYYGRSDEALLRDFVERHAPAQSFETLVDWKRRHFLELLKEDRPIFEGLPRLVEALAVDHKMAVASGSAHPIIDEVLSMEKLHQYFQATVSVYDVGHPKPAPDVFLRAAELLEVTPSRCCVIEDAAVGVTAARSAGMSVVAITNSLPAEQLQHANWIVDDYGAILDILIPQNAN